MSCVIANDVQSARLADAIAERVGQQRFRVWFDNSTRIIVRHDQVEISVPNDFISEWIGRNFSRPIQEAANEVLGCPLTVRFLVMPELFEVTSTRRPAIPLTPADLEALPTQGIAPIGITPGKMVSAGIPSGGRTENAVPFVPWRRTAAPTAAEPAPSAVSAAKLRHSLDTFVVGASNQLAYNAACYVAQYPGSQYNPLFIHGQCGLGKTHLIQGLCRKFIDHHPTKRWLYLTGEEFTNDFLSSLRNNRVDAFRRRMRDLDLLVIDDVHFLGGKKATQEEFLHTFNAIEAAGRQVVMASDEHPRLIEEFGESLINRFVSGMVVRIDQPNFQTRSDILRVISLRMKLALSDEVIGWLARRVTHNVRELEGALNQLNAHVRLTGGELDLSTVQQIVGDVHDQHTPVKPENVLQAVCDYFDIESKDLMSGRRQRTISLARSVAMFLVRKTAKLSFPEIGARMGKRNHSTVISACRRIERAVAKNEPLAWSSSIGERNEEASELIQRLEEQSRNVT